MSEERQRIIDRLDCHDKKLATSIERNRQCLTLRSDNLRRRNQSLTEKLYSHRFKEQCDMERTFESAKDHDKKRNSDMKVFYQSELAKFNEAK